MKLRLTFASGKTLDVECEEEYLKPIYMAGVDARQQPSIVCYSFVRLCDYCSAMMITTNLNQKFCCKSHRNLHSLYGLGKARAKPQNGQAS